MRGPRLSDEEAKIAQRLNERLQKRVVPSRMTKGKTLLSAKDPETNHVVSNL